MSLPTKYVYTLTEERRQQYAGMYLLRKMVLEKKDYSVLLEGDDTFLEGTLGWLYSENWVDVAKGKYILTNSGREHLRLFEERYQDFLKVFYALRFASLAQSSFEQIYLAFEYYYTVDEAQFTAFTQDPAWQWEDLRLAAAELKKMDGLEVVYMSYLNEGQFDTACPRGWQFDLHAGLTFMEIVKTANSLLHADQLGNEAEGVSSEEILRAFVIKAGEVVMMNLQHAERLRLEAEERETARQAQLAAERTAQAAAEPAIQYETTYETVLVPETRYVVETTYYPSSYYMQYSVDPFYVSPIWYTPWYY